MVPQFTPGDLVLCVDNYDVPWLHIGSVYIVKSIVWSANGMYEMVYIEPPPEFHLNWEKGLGPYQLNRFTLEPRDKPYDPTQQGDQDDDI